MMPKLTICAVRNYIILNLQSLKSFTVGFCDEKFFEIRNSSKIERSKSIQHVLHHTNIKGNLFEVQGIYEYSNPYDNSPAATFFETLLLISQVSLQCLLLKNFDNLHPETEGCHRRTSL